MIKHQFGLRAKSVLALLIACIIALVPVGIIAWQVLDNIQEHFSKAYLRNFSLLKRQEIIAPVSKELALSLRLANSVITKSWLADENNPDKSSMFFSEAEGYRSDFANNSYFIAVADSGNYYFVDGLPNDTEPNYQLKPDNETDVWFYNTLKQDKNYNINVNYDSHLKLTQIWFNIIINDKDKKLGIAGSSLDLTKFIENFIVTNEPGMTPMILAENGSIQAHKNTDLIANNQTTGSTNNNIAPEQTLAWYLGTDTERNALANAMQQAKTSLNQVVIVPVTLDKTDQLLAVSYIPGLQWYVVTAMDTASAQFLDHKWVQASLILLGLLIIILLTAFAYTVDRVILRPIKKLQLSAMAITQGNYDIRLPKPKNDEIGDLSRAFTSMSQQIRDQMANLEVTVAKRTQQLTLANQQMQKANKQINDSIQYASLIQQAILPDQQLKRLLGNGYCLIWQPRDLVGGDFYILHQKGNNYLLGVLDCAGHGVPGALMTMLARAALDHAIHNCGIEDPAAILQELDNNISHMLQEQDLPPAIATNIDTGLVYINNDKKKISFSGAGINLYWSNGVTVEKEKSSRRSMGGLRKIEYRNHLIELQDDVTYTLTTDGFLDQAGGENGYGFGNKRFEELLRANATQPIIKHAELFNQALREYRGIYTQRDDITILSFCFNQIDTQYDQNQPV